MKLAFRFLLLYTKSKRTMLRTKLIAGFNLTNENYPDSMTSALLHLKHIFKTNMSASEFLIFSLSLFLLYLSKHLHHVDCLHHIFGDPFVTFFSTTSSTVYLPQSYQVYSKICVEGFHFSFFYHNPQCKPPVSLSTTMALWQQFPHWSHHIQSLYQRSFYYFYFLFF